MNFKKFFENKENVLLKEFSEYDLDRLLQNVKDLLTHKKLPFNNLFGDKLRISDEIKTSEIKNKLEKHLIDDYIIDFEKWVGHKLTDSDKKNPIRIGKILNKKKQDILKSIEQYKNDVNMRMFINDSMKKINEIDELLKISNLQQSYNESLQSQYVIIYSRVPVDVARMSDFSWSSCHSPGGDYFHCALADATLNAAIAYVVKKSELDERIAEFGEDFLQNDEIFKDSERGVDGIQPVARMRIRNLIDKNGKSLAVPSVRLYTSNQNIKAVIEKDFKEKVIKWAKSQDVSSYDWDNTWTLRGGSYEDISYDMTTMVKQIWGKDISYKKNYTDEESFQDNEEEHDFAEEEWWDEQKDIVENEINRKVFKRVLGDYYDDVFYLGYDTHNGAATIEYQLTDKLPKILKKLKLKTNTIEIKLKQEFFVPIIIGLDLSENTLTFSDNRIFITSYGSYDGTIYSYFDKEGLFRDLKKYYQDVINAFLVEGDEISSDSTAYNVLAFNKAIIHHFFEKPEKEIEDLSISFEDFDGFSEDFVYKRGETEDYYDLLKIKAPNIDYNIRTNYYGVRDFNAATETKNTLILLKNELEESIMNVVYENFLDNDDSVYIDFLYTHLNVPSKDSEVKRIDITFSEKNRIDISNNRNRLILLTTTDSFPSFVVKYYLTFDELKQIINSMQLKKWMKIMYWLYNDFRKSIENIKDFDELINYINSINVNFHKYKNYNRNQLELDLSEIIRNTSKFDLYIKELIN